MAKPPPIPQLPSTKKPSKARPDIVGVVTDANGKVLYFDKNGKQTTQAKGGHTRPIPSALGYDVESHTGNKVNTDFGGYYTQTVPGVANLLGLTSTQNLQQGKRPFPNRDSSLPGSMAVGARGKNAVTHIKQPGVAQDLRPDAAMQLFVNMDPMKRAQIEYNLYIAGYYPKNHRFIPGAPANDADRKAFKTLLMQGLKNNAGLKPGEAQGVDDILTSSAQSAKSSGITPDQQAKTAAQSAAAAKRQVNEVTSPTDLNEALRGAFADALGRNPTKDEASRFISSYQGSQIAYQNAQQQIDASGNPLNPAATLPSTYTATPGGTPTVVGAGVQVGLSPQNIQFNQQTLAGAPGAPPLSPATVTQPASPAAAAAEAARTADPAGAAAYSVGNRAQDFYNALIGSPAGTIQTSKPTN